MFDIKYYVDGISYGLKIDAFVAAKGNIGKITGSIYNDRLYRFNWQIEPPESFETLLKERAQQLRDNYSELTLSFSGGRDSFTILETFRKNNIHLDNVQVGVPQFVKPWYEDPGNWEYIKTEPLVDEYRKLMPKTNFSFASYENLQFINDFDKSLSIVGLNANVRSTLPQHHSEYYKSANHCYITGDLEPKIAYRDNSWFIETWDTENQENYNKAYGTEAFYTHPDFPKLHSKQCHICIKYLEEKLRNNEITQDSLIPLITGDTFLLKNLLCRYSHPVIEVSNILKGDYRNKYIKGGSLSTLPPEYKKKWLDLHNFSVKGIPIKQIRFGVKTFSVRIN